MVVRRIGPAMGLAAVVLLVGAVAVAQVAPLTMDGAVERALDGHPELSVWKADKAVHQAAARQALRMDNPHLELELEEWGIDRSWLGEEAEATVAVSQAIPLSNRRQSASRLAGIGHLESEARLNLAQNDIAFATRSRYVKAAMAQDALVLAEAAFQLSQAALDAVIRRIEAGDTPPAERTRAEVDVLEAKLAVADATAALNERRVALAASWGGVVESGMALEPLALPGTAPRVDADGALWTAPMVAARAGADAAAQLARSQAVPDLELGLGWRESGGFESHSLVLSIGAELPLWNRNNDAVDEAQAAARRARFEQAAAERDWRGRLALAEARLAHHRAHFDALTSDVLPALEAAHQTVLEGYKQRRYDTLDLLASQQKLLQAKRRALAAREAYWLSRIEVDWLHGDAAKEMSR